MRVATDGIDGPHNAVERDRVIHNALGFLGGCLIAIVFFRRVSFMIIAAAPPLLAILLSLGALGWFDFQLNMFLNMMTPLVMVISSSDSKQLTFAARDRLIAGDSKADALRWSLTVVGPACVPTHATAAISFIALTFSNSNLIRVFGEAGLIATAVALVTVLVFMPLLGMLLLRREAAFAAQFGGGDAAVDLLRRADTASLQLAQCPSNAYGFDRRSIHPATGGDAAVSLRQQWHKKTDAAASTTQSLRHSKIYRMSRQRPVRRFRLTKRCAKAG
jgi:hypothetical protein